MDVAGGVHGAGTAVIPMRDAHSLARSAARGARTRAASTFSANSNCAVCACQSQAHRVRNDGPGNRPHLVIEPVQEIGKPAIARGRRVGDVHQFHARRASGSPGASATNTR